MTNTRRRSSRLRSVAGAAKRDATIDTAMAGLGAAIGLAAGPIGMVLGASVGALGADLIKNVTHREADRLSLVALIARDRINEQRAAGGTPRPEMHSESAKDLVEGVLQATRRAYEQKKVPILANLIATVPFTGTPIENLVVPLLLVERLTYRQLCICACIPGYDPPSKPAPYETSLAKDPAVSAAPAGPQSVDWCTFQRIRCQR